MKNPKLHIASDLALPINAVTEVIGFIGRRGSGKSYAAQKLAEEIFAAGGQFIAIDPVGIWWGLRLAADGKSPGIPIPVFGGLHGDIPLEPTGGKLLADLIADRGISAVIDVSQFESDADKTRFAHDFGARFYYRRKQAPAAVLIFLEEAQEFVPQNPQREEARMLHVFQRIAKIGRNYGMGLGLISQRPQEVHKKVINLSELLFVFQLTGPHERKSVEGWIEDKGIDEDIGDELPKLKRGAPHAWSPAWLEISKVVHIGEKWTFDSSSTPKVGKTAAARELGPIDMEKLRTAMSATIEKAKAEDPAELRRQLAAVKRELADAQRKAGAERVVQKSVVDEAAIERAVARVRAEFDRTRDRASKELVRRIDAVGRGLGDAVKQCLDLRAAVGGTLTPEQKDHVAPLIRTSAATAPLQAPRTHPPPPRPPRAERLVSPTGDGSLPEGEQLVLTAVAQYPDGATREQVTILTGYKRSTRDAYIQRLRAKAYVAIAGDVVRPTDEGIDALGPGFTPLPKGNELREYWLSRLPDGESKVLEVLVTAYPESVSRDVISELTGYKRSTRDAYIQRLGTRKLITASRGDVCASSILFED